VTGAVIENCNDADYANLIARDLSLRAVGPVRLNRETTKERHPRTPYQQK
jgi:hypothetical protein